MPSSSTLKRARKLLKFYRVGKIKTLTQHEVHPDLAKGSRENYLYFTLPPSVNFQRSSPAMWVSALKTWEDSQTNWVFFPEKAVETERGKVQKVLAKHRLALQTNRHTDIWIAISRTLHEKFKDDPREILKSGDFDVKKVLQIIQDNKKDFPYLSGPKMVNYWLFILSLYTDTKLKNMEELSVVPDTHVIQCTEKLGLSAKKESPEKVAALWKKLLEGSGIAPIEMHPVLWNWSRNNFEPKV